MSTTRPDDIYEDFSPFYDLYVGDRLEDLPLYLKHARDSQSPILEVGAGSGRLTVPLARAGHEIVAVDVSPSMLRLLRARLEQEGTDVRGRVRIVEGDVCDLDLAVRFELVLVPFYAFNYLLTPRSQRMALGRLRSHLASCGQLLVDVFIPRRRLTQPTREPELRVDTVHPVTGDRVRGWNSYQVDERLQVEDRTQSFEVIGRDGTVRKRTFTVRRRYDFPEHLEALFRDCGFSIKHVAAGYEGETPVHDAEQLLFTLTHRGRVLD